MAGGQLVGEIPKIRRFRPDDKEERDLETNKGVMEDGGGERKEDFDIRIICLAVSHSFRSSLASCPLFLSFH